MTRFALKNRRPPLKAFTSNKECDCGETLSGCMDASGCTWRAVSWTVDCKHRERRAVLCAPDRLGLPGLSHRFPRAHSIRQNVQAERVHARQSAAGPGDHT